MAVINEQIVTGRKFRKLIDEASRLWLRVSFWTKACDVEFDDGETAETKFSNITNTIDNLIKSFQDGVNKIYNYLKGLGFTPGVNSPDGICNAIQNMYTKRYNDGRTEGQEEVIANPDSYGISVNIKKFGLVSGFKDTYICPADGMYKVQVYYHMENDRSHNNAENLVKLTMEDTAYKYVHFYYDYNSENWVDDGDHNNGEIIQKFCQAGETLSLDVSENYVSSDDCIITFAAWCVY